MKRLARLVCFVVVGAGCAMTTVSTLWLAGPTLTRLTIDAHPSRSTIRWVKPRVTCIDPLIAMAQLEELSTERGIGRDALLTRASAIVAAGMVNYWVGPGTRDKDVECRLLEDPRHWWRLRFDERSERERGEIDKLCRYERDDWRTALRLGVGYCSQQSLVLAHFLQENGVEARVAALGGHVVVAAQREAGEWILDPDYGVVLPFSLQRAREDAEAVRSIYAAGKYGPAQVEMVVGIYRASSDATYVGSTIGRRRGEERLIVSSALGCGVLMTLAGTIALRRGRCASRVTAESAAASVPVRAS